MYHKKTQKVLATRCYTSEPTDQQGTEDKLHKKDAIYLICNAITALNHSRRVRNTIIITMHKIMYLHINIHTCSHHHISYIYITIHIYISSINSMHTFTIQHEHTCTCSSHSASLPRIQT